MTTVNGVNNQVNNNQDSALSKSVENNLGKDEFLKLLVAQMKNQDPMSPMQDSDFVAQLAQFSALEQMGNVASSVESLKNTMTMIYSQSLLTQGAALIGKEAVALDQSGKVISGRITSVSWSSDSLFVMVGDKALGMESILEIREPGTASSNSAENIIPVDQSQAESGEESPAVPADDESLKSL